MEGLTPRWGPKFTHGSPTLFAHGLRSDGCLPKALRLARGVCSTLEPRAEYLPGGGAWRGTFCLVNPLGAGCDCLVEVGHECLEGYVTVPLWNWHRVHLASSSIEEMMPLSGVTFSG